MLWMAPEVLAAKSYNASADVYSYGMVLWEIASHTDPWSEVPDQSFFSHAILDLILLEKW